MHRLTSPRRQRGKQKVTYTEVVCPPPPLPRICPFSFSFTGQQQQGAVEGRKWRDVATWRLGSTGLRTYAATPSPIIHPHPHPHPPTPTHTHTYLDELDLGVQYGFVHLRLRFSKRAARGPRPCDIGGIVVELPTSVHQHKVPIAADGNISGVAFEREI